jgi:hypothetical protein
MMSRNEAAPIEPVQPSLKKRGMSTGTKVSIAVIVILVAVIAVAILTLSVTTTGAGSGTAFPYTTLYAVSFPEGEPIAIGNSRIVVLSYNNEMVTDVDGEREKLVVGEDRTFAPRHARITVAGIPVLDSDFQILMKYKGVLDSRAYFDLTVRTEKQVPEYLVKQLLPPAVDARPVQT